MLDGMTALAPWIPPALPDLAQLAMRAADAAGIDRLRAWPEVRKGGLAFGDLPPFLGWRGFPGTGWHLVLVQPRELGALVPGARPQPLPAGWLDDLPLADLARPLEHHPDFPGGVHVHVVQVQPGGAVRTRTVGTPAPDLVREVLVRLSPVPGWPPAGA